MQMNNLTEIFHSAKEMLDIKACAEYYGMMVNRNGKGICPFHDDHHPSLSFKGNYFKCFSCGEGGDVFKLVGELTGIQKPVDVLKMLNRDFSLGFSLDNKLSENEKKEIEKKADERLHYKNLDERFTKWSETAFLVCSTYTKMLRRYRTEYAPKTQEETLHPLFVESLLKLDYMEYVMEELIYADSEVMQEFYITHHKEVEKYEQRIEQQNFERTAEKSLS